MDKNIKLDTKKLEMLKKILNASNVKNISQTNAKTVALTFENDIRIFIDAKESGIEFSLHAMTEKGDKAIDELE